MPVKSIFLILGGVLAMLAVICGAFGAHGLEGKLRPESLAAYETAVRYQMFHAIGLMIIGQLMAQLPGGLLNYSGWLMFFGIVLFSGSIYGLTLSPLVSGSVWKILGPVTPIGGSLLVIAWLLFIIHFVKN